MTPQRSKAVSLVGLCAATALGLTACGSSGSGSFVTAPTVSKSASATPTPSPSASLSGGSQPAGGTSAAGTGTGTSSGTGSGGSGTSGTGGGTGATVTLTLTGKPSCPSGTNLVYFPGTDAVISWSVTGAPGVALYVDGSSGAYGFYGPTGSQSLGFPCDAPVNTVRTHTYTITTRGGASASKTISASALVNEITTVTGPTSAPASSPAASSPASLRRPPLPPERLRAS